MVQSVIPDRENSKQGGKNRGYSAENISSKKSYVAIYGIQPPRKWKEIMTCDICEFFQDGKCDYKQIMEQRELMNQRGRPVLAKRSRMGHPVGNREKAEADALRKSGFSADELSEYWAYHVNTTGAG